MRNMKTHILPAFLAALLALTLLLSGSTYRQDAVHEIAELARKLGLPEDDPIIVRAQEIWNEEAAWSVAEMHTEVEETDVIEAENDAAVACNLYSGVLDIYEPETETEAVMLAKTIYAEARGIASQAEQAAIVWAVLNRVDAGGFGSSIISVLTAPHQFCYRVNSPTVDDYGRDLVALARDVLYRWKLEKSGVTDVGRVLPTGYCWYTGNGYHNVFRNSYSGGAVWYWTLADPYVSA